MTVEMTLWVTGIIWLIMWLITRFVRREKVSVVLLFLFASAAALGLGQWLILYPELTNQSVVSGLLRIMFMVAPVFFAYFLADAFTVLLKKLVRKIARSRNS